VTVKPRLVDTLTLFKEALTVTLCAAVTVAVVAMNVALLWPAAKLRLAGTVKAALLLLSEAVPATRAALFNATVQVLEALLLRVEGEQDIEEICAAAIPVRVNVLEEPLSEAVKVAV
jgi:hypothetical protein